MAVAMVVGQGEGLFCRGCGLKVFRRIKMKQQTGFYLDRIGHVIVILGILAATALPRFADFPKMHVLPQSGVRKAPLILRPLLRMLRNWWGI